MVAPLDVDGGEAHELFHNEIGVRAAVVDIAHHVQVIDRQVLNELGQRHDDIGCDAGFDGAIDERVRIEIGLVGLCDLGRAFGLVRVVAVHEQRTDERGIFQREQVVHTLGRMMQHERVRERDQFDDGAEVVGCFVDGSFGIDDHALFGIIDKRSERALLVFGKAVFEDEIDEFANAAGSIAQDVRERGEFAVNIGDEEFRLFREMRGCREARDFGGCLFVRGIERMEGLELLLVLCVHVSPVHRRDNARLFTARLAKSSATIQLPY